MTIDIKQTRVAKTEAEARAMLKEKAAALGYNDMAAFLQSFQESEQEELIEIDEKQD